MQYFESFLQALALTIAIEGLVLYAASRKMGHSLSSKTIAFCAIACSSATLPFVWYSFPAVFTDKFLEVAASEAFAILAEWVLLCRILRISMKDCFFLSLACNTVSFFAGALLGF